jgi:hypothetical protein
MVLGTSDSGQIGQLRQYLYQMLLTLLLDPLEAVGLGNLLADLATFFILGVLPVGLILYFWIRHTRRVKDLHMRGLITSVQRSPEEERAHVEHKKKTWRVVAVLILVLVIFALYQG